MILNELLFYGGIILIIFTLLVSITFFVIYYIKNIKLNSMFDKEYGKLDKMDKH